MALGQICIITPAGMICESQSYEHHDHIPHGGSSKCKNDPKETIPSGFLDRIKNLLDLAGVSDDSTPFVIMTKPAARSAERKR